MLHSPTRDDIEVIIKIKINDDELRQRLSFVTNEYDSYSINDDDNIPHDATVMMMRMR